MQELLKKGGTANLFQDVNLGFAVQRRPIANRLHAILQPAALCRILQVHEFDPDRAAVGLLQSFDDIPQHCPPGLKQIRGKKFCVQIFKGQFKGGKIQQGVVGRARHQRVQTGQQMSHISITVDERLDAGL